MSQMTDDSRAADVSVTQELQDLRHTCDRLDIKWHWRHKATSLLKMIKEREEADNPVLAVVSDEGSTVTATVNSGTVAVRPRTIPANVEGALEYMMSYKRANARLVRSFIESLL